MSINLLTKEFFKENPVKELSTQRLLYSFLLYDGIGEIASEFSRTLINRPEAEIEKGRLEKEDSPEALLKMMRGKCDPLNHELLIDKVLEHEDVLMPQIIKMLRTSGNNAFIELAVKVIKKAKKNYSEELVLILDEIRSPYAVSLTCILIGYLGEEKDIPILLRMHKELKKNYYAETYDQGPLLALIEIRERIKSGN